MISLLNNCGKKATSIVLDDDIVTSLIDTIDLLLCHALKNTSSVMAGKIMRYLLFLINLRLDVQ